MRTHRVHTAMLLLLVSCLPAAPSVHTQEKKITVKDVPAPVLAAFARAYPRAKIRGTSTEVEKGTTYYEIESLDGTQARDILYLADGTVAETEEVIAPGALPPSVNTAVVNEFGKAKIEKAERVRKGADFSYEVHVRLGLKTGSIVVDRSGKVLEKSPLKVKKGKTEEEETEEEED